MSQKILYSVIVPAYNEEENISLLAEKFQEVFEKSGNTGELVIVDDGSSDKTYQKALEFKKHYPFIKVASHSQNLGKTQALVTGFSIAEGDIYVIFDADLQFDPFDVPRMVAEIQNGSDIVTGWKQGKYEKKLVSNVYNRLSQKLFKTPIHDLNSIKAFKKEILDNITLRKDWHRYLVVLAAEQGYKVSEIKVNLYPRKFGKSKYSGWGRILIGVLDLFAVKFQLTFMQKPMLLFGSIGLILTVLGILAGIVALVLRIFFETGFRPLLNLVMLLVLSGILFFILGFLAEAIANVSEKVDELKKSIKK